MKTLLWFTTLILLSVKGNATVIFLDSDAFSTTNDSGHATVDLSGTLHPNPSWAAPLAGSAWISYGSTGDHSDRGYFTPPDGTMVTFTAQFVLSGLITGATLRVMADDSTSVILNGHSLISARTTPGAKCSSQPVGCLVSTEGGFTLAALDPYLVDGANTLKFGVVQVGGSSFGLDFAGCVTTTETPEPVTLACIACGLLWLAPLRRRK